MDEDEQFAFAVEMTAEITMLRQAVAFLFAQHLAPLSEEARAATLDHFESEVGEMPPADLPTPDATRFHEAVAEAMQAHATSFADSLRMILADLPPKP